MKLRRSLLTILLAAALVAGCGARSTSSSSSSAALVDIGAGLEGVAGLRATIYAGGLAHAAAFALDAQERLWVATADYTDHGQDGVYLVASTGATPVEVISGLHTPLGLLWRGGTLYVASKSRVVAYRGLHGSHFTSQRTVLTLPAGVGELNNLVAAPDGRLLVGVSAPCDHCTPASKYSGAIISFRPDGTGLQTYATGIRAAVGLTFFPGTSDLFVTMDYRDDLGANTPGDALAVVRAGTVWGNPGCYGQAGAAACTGVPATTASLDKHAAVSGVAITTGELGAKVGTAAIVAEWAVGKVERVALVKNGTTYAATVAPFLTGIKNPVAVIVTPHNALLVSDWTTGIIYRVGIAT